MKRAELIHWLPWIAVSTATLIVFLFYALLPPTSTFAGIFSDGVRYLLMAEHIAGTDETVTGAWSVFHGSVFPPLYPFVLSFVGADPGLSSKLTASMFALASIPFAMWCRKGLNIDWMPTAACVLMIWISPYLLASTLSYYSESLFLMLVLAATMVSSFDPRPRNAIVLGALIGLAILTRTVGIALLPALMFWLWSARLGRKWSALSLLTPLLMALVWEAYKKATQLGDVSYTSNLSEALSNPLAWLFDTVWANLLGLRLVGEASQCWPLALLLGLLASMQLLRRLRQGHFDAVFVAAYLGIVMLWPFPDHIDRFFIPLVPFVVIFAVLEIRNWRPTWSITAFALAGMLIQSPGIWKFASRMQTPLPVELGEYRATSQFLLAPTVEEAVLAAERLHRLVIASRSVKQAIAPNECVYAGLSELLFYYARVATRPMASIDEMTDCRYVFAIALESESTGFTPMYPIFEQLQFEPVWVSTDSKGKAVASLLDLRAKSE